MSVRRIHHEHINTHSNQRLYPVIRIRTGANRRPHTEMTVGVFACMGEALSLIEILHRDHAAQIKGIVNHQHFLNTVSMQQLLHFGQISALLHRYQFIARRHNSGDQLLWVRFKAHIATRHNTHKILAVEHGHTGYAMSAR